MAWKNLQPRPLSVSKSRRCKSPLNTCILIFDSIYRIQYIIPIESFPYNSTYTPAPCSWMLSFYTCLPTSPLPCSRYRQGYVLAQCSLGVAFTNGLGVAMCRRTAAHWYKLSADNGNIQAQKNLGLLYEYGEGVEKDLSAALALYEKAAAKGDEHAYGKVAQLRHRLGIHDILTTTAADGATVFHVGGLVDGGAVNSIVCNFCHTPESPDHCLKACKCKLVKYCNKECQKSHWSSHKALHRQEMASK